MSIKKGIRENVGRGKNCFEYRGGRGGLCADYQFCSESLGPPIRFWWGKPNPAILVVCHGFSGKNVSKRLTRPFGPRNDIVWEFGLRCIIQFFYVEGRHVVLNRTIRLRGRGGDTDIYDSHFSYGSLVADILDSCVRVIVHRGLRCRHRPFFCRSPFYWL